METITNEPTEKQFKSKTTTDLHEIKLKVNELLKLCQDKEVPFFLTYYHPDLGYQYSGLFPEEINSESVESEYYRFIEFLKVVVNFNAEDFKPVIKKG